MHHQLSLLSPSAYTPVAAYDHGLTQFLVMSPKLDTPIDQSVECME